MALAGLIQLPRRQDTGASVVGLEIRARADAMKTKNREATKDKLGLVCATAVVHLGEDAANKRTKLQWRLLSFFVGGSGAGSIP